jgi:hypothetical protein
VVYIDPSEPARYAAITYAALTLYIVYSRDYQDLCRRLAHPGLY